MIKVAMIGAGSVVFSKNLTGDILGFPEFKNATLSYMDIDRDRLEVGAALCRKAAKAVGAKPKIESTTDRRKALAGADFVINMVQIGGFNSTLVDFEIPRKYGLNFTIADTTGPGGLFRALRTFPMLRGLCRDMEDLCPNAWLLNYSNPMSMNMQTIARTSGIQGVGLCHSVQGTFQELMRYLGEDPAPVKYLSAGINHMAFFLQLQKNGVDLYPRLFSKMRDPLVYGSNKVRFELMQRLGYFVTESSEHNAEYNPFFIPHGKDAVANFNVPLDEYLRRCDSIVEEFERMKQLAKSRAPIEVHRSHEYGSTIIHSIVTGQPSVIYGNMPNHGAIANLPATAIAETATLVDRNGCRFAGTVELPPQLVGYIQPHVTQHELFIRAAMEGRRDHVYQACLFDPLTAAVLPPDKIVAMCDELIAGHGKFLPNLDVKKTLVPGSGQQFRPVNPKALRRSWDAAQDKAGVEYIKEWRVLGPFPSPQPGKVDLDFQPINEAPLVAGNDKYKWQPATADNRGFVDFDKFLGRVEWAVGYAKTEVVSIHPRDVLLRCGSDDGIRIWLNGKLVHEHEVGRSYSPDVESVRVHLVAGVNRLLVKLDNYKNGWGFGIAIPPAAF
jgi:alpha-galactosidase